MKKVISAFLMLLFILYGCGLTGGETTPPSAGIYIIHASPNAPAMDVALNSNPIATGYVYGKDSGYFLTAPGTYAFQVTQLNVSTPVLDQLVNLPVGNYYSMYLIDSFSKQKVLFIEDKLTTDTFSYAKIRLFDFCPNSPKAKAIFASTNQDTLIFSGRYFNDQGTSGGYTNFSAVPAGTYNLTLYQTDTTLFIKDLGNIVFSGGKYYTVYMKGLYDNTTTPLGIATIQH
ncbi:hypothetical protein BH10BAC2_BH10BAC2_47570 [soil metagenome]